MNDEQKQPAGDVQDPAEQYRTDTAVETEKQDDVPQYAGAPGVSVTPNVSEVSGNELEGRGQSKNDDQDDDQV